MSNLIVSTSPHLRTSNATWKIMLDVLIALIPSAVMGVVIFGLRALLVIAATVLTAVATEFIFNVICKRKQTVPDLSAAVTGLILALNLRADAPIWQCVIGAVFAILIVKCVFGGLGCNFANPAATARVFLLVAFTGTLAGGAVPKISSAPELVTSATPLSAMAAGKDLPPLLDMLLGFRGGAIGETCVIAIVLGFVYLVARRVIKPELPLVYVGTVFALSMIMENSLLMSTYAILSGGLIFAAVFMVTDYVTTPITRLGRIIFAFGCGIITFLIRYFGNYPEGVSFAILIMNILSPYIEKLTAPKAVGGKY